MNKIKIDSERVIGKTDKRLFSSFLEQMGRGIYTGIYEPSHPTANQDGFREDVLELVRDLNLEYVRYPGGNFVSGYNWRDGIGPNRPTRLDLAWKTTETNEIGINEFVNWTKYANTKVMGACNLGTGTLRDAIELIEYTNHPGGTTLSDLRHEHGYDLPHAIDLWCIGNEMDGSWQVGQLSAQDYGKKACEIAKAMKLVDDSIKTVAVGSSSPEQPGYPMWDRVVLEETFDYVDYISLHRYYCNEGDDTDFLTSFQEFDDFIKTMAATIKYVKALKRSTKDIYLSVDEWNIWYLDDVKLKAWEKAPEILEDQYSFIDALAFSGLTITLLNNADVVKIACLAQLVNVIAPIVTVPNGICYKQTIYYPFYFFSKYGRGKVLDSLNDITKIKTKHSDSTPLIHSAIVLNEELDELNIFVLNADTEKNHEIEFIFNNFSSVEFIESYSLENVDKTAKNTELEPNLVVPVHSEVESKIIVKSSFKLLRYRIK